MSEIVAGESCFNLNFSNPGGTFLPPIVLNPGSEESSASSESLNAVAKVPNPNQPGVPQASATQSTARRRYFDDPNKILPNGKKTKGRVKIKMEYIDNKLRRYTTFSKRKTGIMKKAYELSTLTGTQVLLLVASETGHVYTFATKKLQPMITSEAGKTLIQTCLNTADTSAQDGSSSSASIAESVEAVAALGSSSHASSPKPKVPRSSPSIFESKSQSKLLSAGLPTMVTSSAAYGLDSTVSTLSQDYKTGTEYLDSDDSSSDGSFDSPDISNNGSNSCEPVAASDNQQHQMIFPTLLPNVSAATALGLMPGLNPSGTLMYQMPQGVVYAPAVSLADGQVLNLGSSNGQNNGQVITIPMPLSLQQAFGSGQQTATANNS